MSVGRRVRDTVSPVRKLSPAYVDPKMPDVWERLVVVATLISVLILLYWEIFDLTPAMDATLTAIDVGLCTLFVIDFAIRFQRAKGFRGRFFRLLAELERAPLEGIDFVRGIPSRADDQARGNASLAASALVFARDPRDARSDHETALTALAFRRANPKAILAAELVDHDNREHLDAADCDAIIDGGMLTAEILVRAVRDATVVRLLEHLVRDDDDQNGLRREPAGELVGKTWDAAARALLDRGLTGLAIVRGQELVLGPERGFVLEAGDEVYVLGRG